MAAHRGNTVTVRYSGYLNCGEAFQTDVKTDITLGQRRVIAGLERGVEGMRVGGIRTLRVAPHLAYRDVGVPGIVSPRPFAREEHPFLRSAPDFILTNPITSSTIREPASLRSDG